MPSKPAATNLMDLLRMLLPEAGTAVRIRRVCSSMAAITVVLTAAARPAMAMTMRVVGRQLILSGFVAGDELAWATDILARVPDIDTVILRNSPGGDAPTGYRLGEMFRAKGLRTAVSGYCYSSCSRMFLGGKTRFFTDDFPPVETNIGFHGHYGSDGKLRPELVRRLGLKDWIIRYSDGKADPALVERWINIPTGAGMAHFYDPALYQRDGASTFLCEGPSADNFAGPPCEPIAETALQLGVVTSLEPVHSNDQAEIRATLPPPPHASGYASIDDIGKLPLAPGIGRSDYERFLHLGLYPRAFAIAPNGMHFAWNTGLVDAPYLALARCQQRAGESCRLYAVDDTVVWQKPQH